MNTYRVTWDIESAVVQAENEDDAWAKFCEGSELATKHPKLHERKIEDLGPVKAEKSAAKEKAAKDVVSPVANLDAAEAKEHIANMRSTDRLQEIVDADPRITVQHAAESRLKELGGS